MMARFDVYRNASRGSNLPLLLQYQSEMHHHLKTCVVIPLRLKKHVTHNQVEGLFPRYEIEGEEYFLITTEISAVFTHQLGKKVASLAEQHFSVVSAVDFLFQGF